VVYDRPRDWPNHFVARLFMGVDPTGDIVLAHDLDALREHLAERGLVRMDRMEGDKPHIVETWL
jgi:hypothetical protein